MNTSLDQAVQAVMTGGPVMAAIAALSVVTLALILWKAWRLARLGAWAGAASERAASAWSAGDPAAARAAVSGRPSLRARVVLAVIDSLQDPALGPDEAREEVTRVARKALAEARSGLRALDLIANVAPLLGLLGTVLGMIAAFRVLQQSGSAAGPAELAGGIWQALLTTAAGMAVAIPASLALGWFQSVIERLEGDMEDLATRLFLRGPKAAPRPVARAVT